jgi:hypothetical protein
MTITKQFPNWFEAVYRGRRYRSSAGGDRPGFVKLFDRETRAQVSDGVPIGELDEWYSIQARGTYLDEPFQVYAEIDETMYWIGYVGGNGIKIAAEWRTRKESDPESAFWQEDRFTFDARVPKEQVHDIHEVREDALGPWRARQGRG